MLGLFLPEFFIHKTAFHFNVNFSYCQCTSSYLSKIKALQNYFILFSASLSNCFQPVSDYPCTNCRVCCPEHPRVNSTLSTWPVVYAGNWRLALDHLSGQEWHPAGCPAVGAQVIPWVLWHRVPALLSLHQQPSFPHNSRVGLWAHSCDGPQQTQPLRQALQFTKSALSSAVQALLEAWRIWPFTGGTWGKRCTKPLSQTRSHLLFLSIKILLDCRSWRDVPFDA